MPALDPALADRLARRFRVLSDPLRLRLLYTLMDGERKVGELVDRTGGHQANVSKHLQVLHQEGIVVRRKEGTSIHYRVDDPMVFELCDVVCGALGTTAPKRRAAAR